MDTSTKKLLQTIFQEAHVIDFDFSKWDKFVRIVISAQLMPLEPLYNIDFHGVVELNWKSENYLDLKLESEEQHCQWSTYDSKIERQGIFLTITFWGTGPAVSIKCLKVEINSLDFEIVNSLSPDWSHPYQPLARGSLMDMYEKFISRRGQTKHQYAWKKDKHKVR